MSDKHIDLADKISEDTNSYNPAIKRVLAWLDRHPDQVPGRTITEGELITAVDETNHEDMNEYQKARALLVHLGHTIPDPEPTNAEKLEKIVWARHGPIGHICRDRATCLAAWLDARGVKAPKAGGDDE